ncbi:hypothetical protein [Halorussus marinus]|uniref:hypothetical protein n=1 Tax=Halorussus marinus TaxID=2505976 RepID=UPI00106E40B0|nr:hypothetical protein [Halorussus marinus]
MSEDLEAILEKAASENAMLARVRRHAEERPVEPRAEDVREAVEIEVRHHRDSQFAEAWTCPSCGGESTEPDSRIIDHANEVRVTCPQCGAVDYIPQGTGPARPREEVSS